VNWRGDGQEFILLSGNPREGGMIDGHLRRVVMFPDDGHPDLAANALDLTGDTRDEIVPSLDLYAGPPIHRQAYLQSGSQSGPGSDLPC